MSKILKIALLSFGLIASQTAFSAVVSYKCNVTEVREIDIDNNHARTHILCANPVTDGLDQVYFFALSLKSTPLKALGLLNLGTAAFTSGNQIEVWFNQGDVSGNSFGCGAINCRVPVNVNISK